MYDHLHYGYGSSLCILATYLNMSYFPGGSVAASIRMERGHDLWLSGPGSFGAEKQLPGCRCQE